MTLLFYFCVINSKYCTMKFDKNLKEYLIEITVKDKNLQTVLDSLNKTGICLDKNFRPKNLKVKSQSVKNIYDNFLVKGTFADQATSALMMNSNIANYWQTNGNIPF